VKVSKKVKKEKEKNLKDIQKKNNLMVLKKEKKKKVKENQDLKKNQSIKSHLDQNLKMK